MLVLIDMDGCLVDLLGPWLARYNKEFGDDIRQEDITEWGLTSLLRDGSHDAVMAMLREPGFFRNLPPRPGALAAVREMHSWGWDLRIATMPSGPESARDKMLWIDEHLGDVIGEDQIILGADKTVYQADIIIDDRPTYLTAVKDRMTTICMGHSYNTGIKDDVDLWASGTSREQWQQIMEFLCDIKAPRAPQIIAFLGRAGSGKTTAAKFLAERFGAEIVSFAAPIKAIARDVYGFTDEQLYGPLKEDIDPRYGISPRWFMQRLGCGARDHLWESVWLDAALKRAEMSRAPMVVIDDCRFINEAKAVVAAGGTVIRIDAGERAQRVIADASESEINVVPESLIEAVIENGPPVTLDGFLQMVAEAAVR